MAMAAIAHPWQGAGVRPSPSSAARARRAASSWAGVASPTLPNPAFSPSLIVQQGVTHPSAVTKAPRSNHGHTRRDGSNPANSSSKKPRVDAVPSRAMP
jgi:hypothetical protein